MYGPIFVEVFLSPDQPNCSARLSFVSMLSQISDLCQDNTVWNCFIWFAGQLVSFFGVTFDHGVGLDQHLPGRLPGHDDVPPLGEGELPVVPDLAQPVVHGLGRLNVTHALVDLELLEEVSDGRPAHALQLGPVHGQEQVGVTILTLDLLQLHEALAGLQQDLKRERKKTGLRARAIPGYCDERRICGRLVNRAFLDVAQGL